MAEALLQGALQYLSSAAAAELAVFLGFDRERENLDSKFNEIKATLQDAEEKQFTDRAIKDWLRKLKDAAYELDDIRDECAYEELRLEYEEVKCCLSEMVLGSSLSSFHPKYAIPRYQIAKKMKRISERLDDIAKERQQLHLTDTAPDRKTGVPEWRKTISSISVPQVYGRRKDTERIVDFLTGDADASLSENLSVYPILGQGGLGKTTLAQLIFKHERVVNHFPELRIWVCVSEDFSLQRMMKAIIEAAEGKPCGVLDPEPLHRKLQDLLRSKKYLLVLDDVWDDGPNNWQMLRSVLDCGAKGASVLVTTRLTKVAEIMGTTSPHELSFLSSDECWELFKNAAFGPNEAEQPVLVDIGKKIIKKCGGVPLAAKAVGGLLRFKKNKNQWLNVLESNLLELSDDKNSIMPVLRLSYLNLPIELRPCFTYCAIFPKDEEIEKEYLIELWMANGFIQGNGILDAEDVGDDVWNELYWRSFFQDIETDETGRVITFKMHDLFHDLAQFVAEDICCITDENGSKNLSERIHHVSDYRSTWKSSQKVISFNLPHISTILQPRTYNIFQPDGRQLSPHVLECNSLRVLQCGLIKEMPPSIDQLKYLRYLNLSWSVFETLPESLSKLWNLQILKLDDCQMLQKLPDSLIQMKALEKLSLNSCRRLSSLPPQIGKLTSLRSLTTYIVGRERGFLLAELGTLNLKGEFCIKNLERVKSVEDAKEANMSRKQLSVLWLSWGENEEWELQENVEEILEVLQPDTQHLKSLTVERYKGAHFPKWMSSSPSLESLTLSDLPNPVRLSREDGENMFPRLSTLAIYDCSNFLAEEVLVHGLRSLKRLAIYGCDKLNVSVGFQCLTSLENFRIKRCREVEGLDEALKHMTSLKMLQLYDLPNLESLPDCFGNLPLLRHLTVGYCFKLRCLPISIRLSSLERLFVTRCHAELKKRCEKEKGEDWPNIAHIPYVQLNF